jgi:hypothetical protein
MAAEKPKSLFGKLREAFLRPLVTVPGRCVHVLSLPRQLENYFLTRFLVNVCLLTSCYLSFIVLFISGGKGDLLDCPFCETTGKRDCEGCRGMGTDTLGTCLMCDGKKSLTCSVCEGMGMVDRIRRGGTDDRAEFLGAKSKGRAKKTGADV